MLETFDIKENAVAINRAKVAHKFSGRKGSFRNEYQLHYIIEGTRYFFINRKQYRMTAGTLTFVDKKQIPKTNILGGENYDRVLVEINEKQFSLITQPLQFDLAAFFESHHGVYILSQSEKAVVEKFFGEMANEMYEKSLHHKAKSAMLLIELFIYLDRRNLQKAMIATQGLRMSKDLRVHEIADYIQLNYGSIKSLDSLAHHFYVDKSYLSRIFKEITNFTVSEYINLQRIKAAKDLLLETDLSVSQISQKIGYESLTYFERNFNAQTGLSPLKYRKKDKETHKKAKPFKGD